MANYSWKTNGNGDWSVATNWGGGGVPGSYDAVTLGSQNKAYTVTVDGLDAALSLALSARNGTHTTTLDVAKGYSLTVGTGGITMGSNTVINIEGTLTDTGVLSGSAPASINLNGGTFNLTDAFTGTNLSSTVSITFGAGTDTLDLGVASGVAAGIYTIGNSLSGFGAGDKIDLTGAGSLSSFTALGGNSYLLTTSTGYTFNFTNLAATGVTLYATNDGSGGVEIVCYMVGTRILTPRGEVAVEDLHEGDLVTTFSGRGAVHKPITWIGQLRESLAGHAESEKAWPVRIRAGAVAENVPHRDLLVSPDHAIYLGGVLIPAKELVNGATIVQDRGFDEVHYFHIELDEHDILLAEGLTAESYLDTGNRDAFAHIRSTPRATGMAEELRLG